MLSLPSLYKLYLLSLLGILHVFQVVFSSAHNDHIYPWDEWGLILDNVVFRIRNRIRTFLSIYPLWKKTEFPFIASENYFLKVADEIHVSLEN